MCFQDPKNFNPNGARKDAPVSGPAGRGYQLYAKEEQANGRQPMPLPQWQAAKQRGEV